MTSVPIATVPTTRFARSVKALRRILGRTEGAVGLGLVLLVLVIAVIGPIVSGRDPDAFVTAPYAQPGAGLPFGADNLGRDVLGRFLYGGLRLLEISALATVVGVSLGAGLALLIGSSRGRIGPHLMRVVDIALAFPFILFVLLFVTLTGSSWWQVAMVIALIHVAPVTRVVRPVVAEISERDFVRSAEAIGVPRRRILLGEILPNLTPTLSVEYGLRLTFSVGIVAALSYLGFGTPPGVPDWGSMISDNQLALTTQPWPVLLPSLAIACLAVGANLLTDSIARSLAVRDE